MDGLQTICGQGDPSMRSGMSIMIYTGNTSMDKEAFANADGDLLIVPQQGTLIIQTEMGYLRVEPTEIAVIQRKYT